MAVRKLWTNQFQQVQHNVAKHSVQPKCPNFSEGIIPWDSGLASHFHPKRTHVRLPHAEAIPTSGPSTLGREFMRSSWWILTSRPCQTITFGYCIISTILSHSFTHWRAPLNQLQIKWRNIRNIERNQLGGYKRQLKHKTNPNPTAPSSNALLRVLCLASSATIQVQCNRCLVRPCGVAGSLWSEAEACCQWIWWDG